MFVAAVAHESASAVGPATKQRCPSFLQHDHTLDIMIRRNPTMIAMADADVQEIRERLSKQNAEYEKMNTALDRMYYIAQRPNLIVKEDLELFKYLKDHEHMVGFMKEIKAHDAILESYPIKQDNVGPSTN